MVLLERSLVAKMDTAGDLWTPDMAAGLSDWFTASHTPSVTTPNSNVTSWTTRRSGGTNNLITATGTPTHDGSSINFLNGNHTLSDTSIDNGAISNGSCMLYVVCDTDKVASHYIANYDVGDVNPGLGLRYWQPTNSWYAYCHSTSSVGNVAVSASQTAANQKVLLGVLIRGTEIIISVNGVMTSGGSVAVPFTSTRFILNKTATSLGRIYDIESFATYDTGTAQRIEGELAAKHGITLPAGHPYRLGAPTTAWNPSDDTGLTIWYDFADASTITITGAGISSLLNKAAAGGYTLAQATDAQRPIWNGSKATGRSGGNGLFLDTTVSWAAAAHTIITNCTLPNWSSGVSKAIYGLVTSGANSNVAYVRTNTSNGVQYRTNVLGDAGADQVVLIGYTAPRESLLTFSHDGGTTKSVWAEGTNVLSNTNALNTIGAADGIRLLHLTSDVSMGSFIATSTTSTALRQKHEGKIAWDKGVQANLDAGHPYKSRPPLITD